MADTGYKFATSTTASTGTWGNVGNMFATDGAETSTTISTKSISSWRVLNNFGFDTTALPDGSTINTVNLRTVWRVTTTAGIATLAVAPLISGTRLSTITNALEPTSLSTQTFDITSVTTWTAANFRDGTLTVLIGGWNGNSATNPDYRFDSVSLDVLYTPPVTPRVLRQYANLDGCGSDGIFLGNSVE